MTAPLDTSDICDTNIGNNCKKKNEGRGANQQNSLRSNFQLSMPKLQLSMIKIFFFKSEMGKGG